MRSVWGTSVTVPVTISTSYYYYYVPQTKLGNILFLLCFLLLLLRSSVSNGRPYCFRSVSFSLLLFFLPILCTRFLENDSPDFHQTFKSDRYLSEPCRKFSSLMTSLPVARYGRFSDF